jgi:hypothetical protein
MAELQSNNGADRNQSQIKHARCANFETSADSAEEAHVPHERMINERLVPITHKG